MSKDAWKDIEASRLPSTSMMKQVTLESSSYRLDFDWFKTLKKSEGIKKHQRLDSAICVCLKI